MTVEIDILAALNPLAGEVYPDIAPLGVARPFIVFQQVGGSAVGFLENTIPSKKNARFQINAWSETRLATAALALEIETAMSVATAFQARPLSAPVAIYEEDTKLYGTRQDFTVWSDR